MLLSLVIPTLNEAGSIVRLLGELDRVRGRFPDGVALEAIVVDDGSTDGTIDAAKGVRVGFPLMVISRTERGLATAVLSGFAAAAGEILGVMDADLSHPPELLPELLSVIGGADIAVASRHAPGGRVEEWPWYRYWASMMMTRLTVPLRLPVTDPLSGYFLLRHEVIEGVALSPIGYKILLEVLCRGRYRRVAEVPYVFRNRDVGKSKMGLAVTIDYMRHLIRLSRTQRPDRSLDTPGAGH